MKLLCLLPFALSAALLAQDAETIFINGKILTADAQFSTQQALAVRDGKIAAVGSTAQIRKLAGAKTRVIDLGGRTVIPGLIDSHMHAIRVASFFATESNWAGVADAGGSTGSDSGVGKRQAVRRLGHRRRWLEA